MSESYIILGTLIAVGMVTTVVMLILIYKTLQKILKSNKKIRGAIWSQTDCIVHDIERFDGDEEEEDELDDEDEEEEEEPKFKPPPQDWSPNH